MSLVMTKAALALKNPESNFTFVKFEAHKAKKKPAAENSDKSEIRPETRHSSKDLDLKKIRHEVVKFGMSGFDPAKKEEARIALAVSLGLIPDPAPATLDQNGANNSLVSLYFDKLVSPEHALKFCAKPPKKEYLNYKDLMQKRKQEKIKEIEEKQQMRSKSVLQTGGKKKKKGVKNDVGHFLSSYGKVNKKDLLKKDDKGSKKKKKKSKII